VTQQNQLSSSRWVEIQIWDVLRWLCIILLAFSLSACEINEESVSSSDDPGGSGSVPTPPGTPPPPPPPAPGPTDQAIFEATLYPHLTNQANFCVTCHGVTQAPTFAVADATASYNAIVTEQKVNLNAPDVSRVYLRPKDDRHNCGGDIECDRIAADFLTAIQDWGNQASANVPPPTNGTPVVSMMATFADAEAGGSARADGAAIALFTFSEGAGDVTMDTSGVGDPITLNITGMEWVEGGGLRNVTGKAEASVADSSKLFDMISPVGEFSVEAWVTPELEDQPGPTRIASYSLDEGGDGRNFELDQAGIYYRFRNRSTNEPDAGGAFDPVDAPIPLELQHVVMTFDPVSGRKIYVDGQLRLEENVADTLAWVENSIFVIGNTPSDNRLWLGEIKLVAVHAKALTATEVQQNFAAGTGTLVTIRFDVSSVVGQTAHIEMQAAQLDSTGYMFANPMYVSDATAVAVKNIRIGVNGAIPVAAQPFRRVDMMAMQSGELLSPLGAIIPVELGADNDQFHLEFEVLGDQFGLAELTPPSAPPLPLADTPEPVLGLRTFSQVNDTMSNLTGIDPNQAAVLASYSELRGSLPSTSNILSFAPAQQIAIQRLAITYCGEVANNAANCDAFFGACAVDGNNKGLVSDALYDRFIGDNLADQPDRADVSTEIVRMIDDLGCAAGCTGAEAQTVLQATCGAVLSSGAVTVN
jgi:hypothetical protein